MNGNELVRDENGDPIIDSYGEPIRMVQGATSSATVGVFFKGSKKKVPYKSSLKIGDTDYQDVFLLKAGQTGVIKFPNRDCKYEIIECGVDTEVYDQVSVNGEAITGTLYNNTDTGAASGTDVRRQDFGIDYETTGNRPRAEYSNQVAPGVMRNLSFEKLVYDSEGNPIPEEQYENISEKFNFRLYLGDEFSDENDLAPANMYSYYVKAPGGSYCRWNQVNQRFEPLELRPVIVHDQLAPEKRLIALVRAAHMVQRVGEGLARKVCLRLLRLHAGEYRPRLAQGALIQGVLPLGEYRPDVRLKRRGPVHVHRLAFSDCL